MNLKTYSPNYHILGQIKIKEIIISSGCIQLECVTEDFSFLPYLTVPKDRNLSIIVSKAILFEIIDSIPKPFEILWETDDDIGLNPDAGIEDFNSFCADIELGLLQTNDMPGIIEIEKQYPMFHEIPQYCLLVGYRPMGKCADPFDLEYFKELIFNHNSFLADKVIIHNLIGMHRPFKNKDFFVSSHRDDKILDLLELYLILKENGYNHFDSLEMSCLHHEWFLELAKELAKKSDYYDKLIELGLK